MERFYIKNINGERVVKMRRFILPDKTIAKFTDIRVAIAVCNLLNGVETSNQFSVCHSNGKYIVYMKSVFMPIKVFAYNSEEDNDYAFNLACELRDKLNETNLL